jgi:hypothetical protein
MTRGLRVLCIVAASTWVFIPAEDLPGVSAAKAAAVNRKGVSAMEVVFDRVAGLDVGKGSGTACLRVPGARRGRHA